MTTTRNRIEAANAHLAANRLEQALAMFEQVLREHPETVPAYLGIGRIHLHRGDHQDAERYFVGAAHVARNPARALMMQAVAVEAQGETERALELAHQALRHDQNLLRARLMAARLGMRLEQFDAAETLLRETLRLHPDSEMALSLLTQLYRHQGRPLDELQSLVEQLLAHQPDEESRGGAADSLQPASQSQGRRRALLLLRMQQFAEAEALLARHLEAEPNDTGALLAHAQALLGMGKHRVAIALLEDAQPQGAERVQVGLQLARAYLASSDFDSARALLTDLTTEDRQLPVVHFLLAEVFCALKQLRQAAQEYEAVLLNAPQLVEDYPALAELSRMTGNDVDRVAAYRTAFAEVEELSLS